MLRTLGLALLAVVSAVGPTLASGFTEKGLSLLSYQLCNQSVARSVPSVEAVQTSLLTHVPCGRWVPWRRCPKTVYRTRFQAVEVPERRNVTDCCEGYEQLGLYCVLRALGEVFPAGLAVKHPAETLGDPKAPEGTLAGFWYNVTVLVKMDFKELRQVDPGLRDHMRLLHSMNHSVQVEVYKGEELLRTSRTRGTSLEVAGLEAGVRYGVKTSYQACGANIAAALTVKTDARVFEVTVRILNHNVTERLLDRSSPEYRNFSRQLLHEVENSFPPAVSNLYRRGKLRVQIVSLQAGSVVVRLRLTAWDPEFPVDVSTLAPMLPPLWASGLFRIDPRGTRVQDWDECADSLEHDCSPAAQCINLEGSYTCRCRTAGDANPSRPGRACEGDVVSPTGAVLTPVTGETAPAPSTEATALGLETPARSHSPAHPWDTPAVGQAWTPGPPPRRGVSGTVGYGSNSTGQGVEEEASTALGLETGQWTASRVANTAFAPRAPGPTPSSLPRATDILLDPLGGLPPNSTTEPPFWPTPTEGPTGHIEWHASLPTRDTLAAPLDPTWPQNSDPGPSGSPDLPSAPAPASPKIPACGEWLGCASQRDQCSHVVCVSIGKAHTIV
ncbi:Uromodulin-like 1 [Camelus dromedarius]|uniref:Uromodulin-like 1 n=1 Tax=Camelus dromedarius TaxID=9838 RepID=A0A5N4EKC3_CAMDR|nr:Uromodulin-like 1 [Camelus dromedarius]KAB1283801.1 Uromodulin-like 1 [Camelus dromedarius]